MDRQIRIYETLLNSVNLYYHYFLLITGTFKLKKVTVQKEGFNVNIIKDKVFFLDAKQKAYVPLTADLYNKIISGEARL